MLCKTGKYSGQHTHLGGRGGNWAFVRASGAMNRLFRMCVCACVHLSVGSSVQGKSCFYRLLNQASWEIFSQEIFSLFFFHAKGRFFLGKFSPFFSSTQKGDFFSGNFLPFFLPRKREIFSHENFSLFFFHQKGRFFPRKFSPFSLLQKKGENFPA